MIGREKANVASLEKIYLLTPDQLSRLLGKERERLGVLQRESSDALGRAERDVRRYGDSARAYALFRGAQQQHLSEAARERETPLTIEAVSAREQREEKKKPLPGRGIEPAEPVEDGDGSLERSPAGPAPTSDGGEEKKKKLPPVGVEPGLVEKRRRVRTNDESVPVPKSKLPWLLRSKTKMNRVT